VHRKNVLLLLLSIVLLAGGCSMPSINPALKTPTASVPASSGGVATSTGFVAVRLYPGDGSLTKQLSAEVQKAAAQGLKPFVEFDASW
jgi:hypothetical protein